MKAVKTLASVYKSQKPVMYQDMKKSPKVIKAGKVYKSKKKLKYTYEG